MTLVWIDVLTPKQALFFWPLSELLGRRGLETLITARRYEQLDWILSLLHLKAEVLGRFGGESLLDKLVSSTERQRMLLKNVAKRRPSLAISSGSVEMSRICFGLQIPHILASDSPHSPVNRICVPLSAEIITPYVISYREWIKWGAQRSTVARYRGLDPIAWIKRYERLKSAAPQPPAGEYALVRVPEYKASYILGKGLAETVKAVKRVANLFGRVIVLCRYKGEAEALRRKLPKNATLISRPVLALPYIERAALVMSGGGTMAQEAALLGKPTILFYPGETPAVHRFLASKGLLWIVDPNSYDRLERLCDYLTSSRVRKRIREKSEKMRRGMEDPALFIERRVLALLG